MFLRCNQRKKDGKVHRYYRVVENRRVAHGRVVQKPVLYLGEITDGQQQAWRKSLDVFDVDQNRSVQKYLFALEEGQICAEIDAIPVKLSAMVLSNPRDFGDCWLGGEIWGQLGLDQFWAKQIDTRQRTVPFSKVLKLLTINRLIKPGAEFYVHRHWFDQTAKNVRLDCDLAVAEKNRLYRCLDHILVHQDALCVHLKNRWETMFNLEYNILRYDLTSTYFEGLCQGNPKAKFGHRKDRRSDCRQILIALVVTPEGFPINYEVLAGNTGEKTTLTNLLSKIEKQYGKAQRVWLMDRGIPTEQSLSLMRETGIEYLVGTPRKCLDEFQQRLLDVDWQEANESVRVKTVNDQGETYVLAGSQSRRAKERAMRKRQIRDYLRGLEKLQKNYRDRDRFMKRLGVLQHQAGSSRHCVELTLPPEGVKVSAENFHYRFNAQIYKEMIYRDGTYFLRTNQTGKGAIELWQQYVLQTHVEQAFKELKSDLSIRPIRHHLEERVEAHVFIAFMSYCLQMTLRQKLRQSAPGLTSRAALELFSKIKMLDVTIPTADHRTIHLQRYTQPEMEHKILLDKLKMTLPRQAPPKIYRNQYKK